MCEIELSFDFCFLEREIASAITFSLVLIYDALIPNGEFTNREQKKRARRRPIFDLLHVCIVQLSADVLSVMLSMTGYGSFVNEVVRITCRDAK